MKIENESSVNAQTDQNEEVDCQPLIDLFELLLEWDMKDTEHSKQQRRLDENT